MNSHKNLPYATILSTFVLALFFALVVTGCGTSVGAAGSPATPSPLPSPTSATAQKCGTIAVRPGSTGTVILPGDTKADVAGNCFWQAFQQCHAASLIVNFSGVDTIATHTFAVQKKGTGCAISDAMQNRVIPQPVRDNGTFTCNGLVNTGNELHFSGCGTKGDIVVPIGKS